MQDICCKLSRLAAVAVLMMAACVGSAWAGGVPWQVGDVVVCYGSGSCNVIRIVGSTATVLDSLSDAGFLGTGTPGFTYGAAIDDALHLLVTDGGSGAGSQSNIVKYSIASRNWLNNPSTLLTHTIIATFDGSVGTSSEGIRSVALDSAGHLFVGNSSPATIAEIDQNRPAGNSLPLDPTPPSTFTFNSGWRAFTQYPSSFIIIDANKFLQKVTAAGTSGSGLPGFSQTPTGTTADGTVTWTNIGSSQTDLGSFSVSGITPPTAWAAKTCYDSTNCTTPSTAATTVFDNNGHLQQVKTPGTSGSSHPTWNDAGGTTIDNAVIWKDLGSTITWVANHAYSQGNLTIGKSHVQQETVPSCTSGVYATVFSTPGWSTDGDTITDGTTNETTNACMWIDLGPAGSSWAPNMGYLVSYTHPTGPNTGQLVTDSSGHVQQVQTAGTSGPGSAPFTGSATTIDGLQWTDNGLPSFGANCIGNQLASLDLGSGTSNPAVYFTSGGGTFDTVLQDGVVQQVATPLTPNSNCKVIADFGPNVTLSALKVLPAGATDLNSSTDAVLVLAKGTIDSEGTDVTDPDENTGEKLFDVCSPNTQVSGTPSDSCALLINTADARY